MGVINTYPLDTTATTGDKYLTVASDNTTKLTDFATLQTAVVANSEATTTADTRVSETHGNLVASGLIWSTSSGLIGTMTTGIVYIGGKRISVNAIASKTFTANQDTYVYVDNTGTVGYSTVANNATSPSLPANSIWLAIVVSGASITSINLGLRSNSTLPKIGNYIVRGTDVNGNPIYPTALCGAKAISLNDVGTLEATSSTSATDLTTVGPVAVVNVGQSGAVRVYWGATVYHSASGNFAHVTFSAAGANTIAALTYTVLHKWGSEAEFPMYRSRVITGLTPGATTFTLKYLVNAGTANFSDRQLIVEAL